MKYVMIALDIGWLALQALLFWLCIMTAVVLIDGALP